MKDVFLFPHRFKVIGLAMLLPAFVFAGFVLINDFEFAFLDWQVPWDNKENTPLGGSGALKDNFTNELAMIWLLVSLVFTAFSKTKEEDEYVQKIRHDSLLWSLYVNYGLLFLAILGVYEFAFFNVLLFNMYTPLIIFIIRFQYYYSKR